MTSIHSKLSVVFFPRLWERAALLFAWVTPLRWATFAPALQCTPHPHSLVFALLAVELGSIAIVAELQSLVLALEFHILRMFCLQSGRITDYLHRLWQSQWEPWFDKRFNIIAVKITLYHNQGHQWNICQYFNMGNVVGGFSHAKLLPISPGTSNRIIALSP